MVYSSGDGGGGLLGAIISAAIEKASPSYMPLARRANGTALAYPGPGFPAGPYHPEHGRDWTAPAGAIAVAAPASTSAPVLRPRPRPGPRHDPGGVAERRALTRSRGPDGVS